MRTLFTRVGRWLDLRGPGQAATIVLLIWALSVAAAFVYGRAAG